MAATATTAVAPSPPPLKEDTLHDPVLRSGPGLSDAVITATATPAQMVAVPLSEQHPVTLSGPGVNAFLQAEPILVSTATTINEAAAAGPTADATVAERQGPVVPAVAMSDSSTSIAAASAAESVVMQSRSGVAAASTTAVVAAEATMLTTAVAEDESVAISDTESAITVVETQSASKVERLSTAAETSTPTQASGSSMLMSTFAVDTVAMPSVASKRQDDYTSSDQFKTEAVVESKAESCLLVSHLSSEHIKAHRSSQGLDVASGNDPIEALDRTQTDVQEQNSVSESTVQGDLSTTISGIPLLAQRLGSKLEQMHSALRTQR
ncbi:TPA: hypothetical protein ACH3X1_014934 [Trebouxia sp. C0004]